MKSTKIGNGIGNFVVDGRPGGFEILLGGHVIFDSERVGQFQFNKPRDKVLTVSGNFFISNHSKSNVKSIKVTLPHPQRANKHYKFPKVPNIKKIKIFPDSLKTSFASVFRTDDFKIIEIHWVKEKFENCTPIERRFILLHELAHAYYSTEEYCDIYATYYLLKMGWDIKFILDDKLDVLENVRDFKRLVYFQF